MVGCWRAQPRRSRRVLALLGAALAGVLAALARINVYETVAFHAHDRPLFAAVSEVKLDVDEKVLAVKIHGKARAYPVRSIAYYHIINDHGIVATY
jgi:hypothetical protein